MLLHGHLNVTCNNKQEIPYTPKETVIKRVPNIKHKRDACIHRMNNLLILKKNLVMKQWEFFENTRDRIFLNMMNIYDTSCYAYEEKAYNDIAQHIERIEKEITVLRISLENDTFDYIPHNKEIVKDNESNDAE